MKAFTLGGKRDLIEPILEVGAGAGVVVEEVVVAG